MYVEHELNAIFNRSRSLAVDFENMTSKYKNCGFINAVTNLCRVFSGVNYDNVHSTFRQALDS
jgi:hypothetical protein